jgi:hypothetical protein
MVFNQNNEEGSRLNRKEMLIEGSIMRFFYSGEDDNQDGSVIPGACCHPVVIAQITMDREGGFV